MGYLTDCDCGHTLEYHLADVGFVRCRWSRGCAAALNALLLDVLGTDGSLASTPGIIERSTDSGNRLSLVVSHEPIPDADDGPPVQRRRRRRR
jgi:hypothetical protein